ncbi:MAG: hypothetical protein MHPSP_003863, partial [Paramarteilia canceri]
PSDSKLDLRQKRASWLKEVSEETREFIGSHRITSQSFMNYMQESQMPKSSSMQMLDTIN